MATARGSIILTGFMGTGKSSVGMALANRLGLEFVDTDALIESHHGPIADLVATHGEQRLREIEADVIQQVASPGRVIATGDGTVVDPANAQALASAGLIYCLVASPQEIARRMDALAPPPAADGSTLVTEAGTDTMTRVTNLLVERLPVYSQFPQIRTDGRQPEAIAAEIANDAANRGLVSLGKEPRPKRDGGRSPLLIGVASFVVVGLLAAAALYLFGGSDDPAQVEARIPDPPSQDLPDGAPEGDQFIDIVLVDDQTREAEERFQEWFDRQNAEFGFEGFGGGQQLVEGSVIHTIRVGSRTGTIDVYQWEVVNNFPGERPQELRCTGEVTEFGLGGGQNCFPTDFDDFGTSLSWGGIQNGPNNWLSTISVVNAPEDAAWMRTELRGELVIVSAVVGGYGFAEFDNFDGDPRQVVLLDADLNEVWSERMF